MSRYLETCLRPAVVRTALKVALLVGTLLAVINHGPALVNLSLTTQAMFQILLTYLVPYGVSTYSSVKFIRRLESGAASD